MLQYAVGVLICLVICLAATLPDLITYNGTEGVYADSHEGVFPVLQVRGGVNYFNYDADFNADDTDYTGDLEFSGGGLFVQVSPAR